MLTNDTSSSATSLARFDFGRNRHRTAVRNKVFVGFGLSVKYIDILFQLFTLHFLFCFIYLVSYDIGRELWEHRPQQELFHK